MRIIHTADLHLDSKLGTNLSKGAAQTRRSELIQAFQNLCEYARNNSVYIIIIAGDFFDTISPTIKTVKAVEGIIKTYSEITFLYTLGNHDEFNFKDYLSSIPDNLKIFSNTWSTFTFGNIAITGINFNDDTRKYMYETLNLDPNMKNIVVLHGQISKYSSSDSININALKDKGIDYLALGHIHSYSSDKLDDRGIYVYPGCLEGRGFDEAGKKGFVLINETDESLCHTFIKSSIRQIHDLTLDISSYKDLKEINDAIDCLVANIDSNDMVYITLTGEFDVSLCLPLDLIEQRLNNKFFFARCKDESKLRINPNDYVNDISLKGEFIRNVMLSEEDIEIKKDIILTGIRAITGGDI